MVEIALEVGPIVGVLIISGLAFSTIYFINETLYEDEDS